MIFDGRWQHIEPKNVFIYKGKYLHVYISRRLLASLCNPSFREAENCELAVGGITGQRCFYVDPASALSSASIWAILGSRCCPG